MVAWKAANWAARRAAKLVDTKAESSVARWAADLVAVSAGSMAVYSAEKMAETKAVSTVERLVEHWAEWSVEK